MKEQVEVSPIESEKVARRLLRAKGKYSAACALPTSKVSPPNQFFMSFLHAYNQHGDVLLQHIYLKVKFPR